MSRSLICFYPQISQTYNTQFDLTPKMYITPAIALVTETQSQDLIN